MAGGGGGQGARLAGDKVRVVKVPAPVTGLEDRLLGVVAATRDQMVDELEGVPNDACVHAAVHAL